MADETKETAAAEPQSADLKDDSTPSIAEVADALGLSAPEAATDENSEPTKVETEQPHTEEPQPEPEPASPPQEANYDRTQAKIDARIGKEVAKRKELEEQVESEQSANRDLARQLEEARQAEATARRGAMSPDDVTVGKSPTELNELEQKHRDLKKWAVENWDGHVSEDAEGTDFDAEEVRSFFNGSVDILDVKIPEARRRLREGVALQREAVQKYPFLVDKNAPEFEHAAFFYNSEAYRRAAETDPRTALEMLGEAALGRAQAANGTSNQQARATPAPPSIPTDSAPAGRSAVSSARTKTDGLPIDEFVAAGGSHDALVNLIQTTLTQ